MFCLCWQKTIVRILTGSDYRAHFESLFYIELKIMNVFQLHRYFTGIFVFKCFILEQFISSFE